MAGAAPPPHGCWGYSLDRQQAREKKTNREQPKSSRGGGSMGLVQGSRASPFFCSRLDGGQRRGALCRSAAGRVVAEPGCGVTIPERQTCVASVAVLVGIAFVPPDLSVLG